jgi:putative serine protease PepD
MPFDDEFDNELDGELASGFPPPAADRLWRHPSELFRAPPRIWSVALVAAVAGAVLGTGITFAFVDEQDDRPAIEVVQSPVELPGAQAREDDIAEVAERVRPAIVQVRIRRGGQGAWASGFFFRDDGHVLTSEHLINGAEALTVVLDDGEELAARLIGADADTDVAVVKVDGGPYTTARLGVATAVRVGMPVVAIGTGQTGAVAVSAGVVSALGRSIERPGKITLLDMIQTDTRLAPGTAGGALLDRAGGVVGLTAAGAPASGDGAMGYATRISIVRAIAEEIIKAGRVVHPWLGIEGADLQTPAAQRLGVTGGVDVTRVVPRGPADGAGMAAGDVVVTLNGDAVSSMSNLLLLLRSHKTGDEVSVGYLRKGRRVERRLTLVERPPA